MHLTRAIVLSAGLGTRMRPLTHSMPKPMIPVHGKPLIDWCLDWLREADIADVVVNTSYRAQQLEDYLHPRNTPRVHFSREEPAPLSYIACRNQEALRAWRERCARTPGDMAPPRRRSWLFTWRWTDPAPLIR